MQLILQGLTGSGAQDMFFKSRHLHRRMNDQDHLLHRDRRINIEAQCQSEALVVNDDKQNAGITFNEAK